MSTRTRDFAAEYFAARKDSRQPGATLTERSQAQRVAAKVARAAERAGVYIDEVELDEQARLELYPPTPGAPVYG